MSQSPVVDRSNGKCAYCGSEMVPRKGKLFCSGECRHSHWEAKHRQMVIDRHLTALNSELKERGMEPYGTADTGSIYENTD